MITIDEFTFRTGSALLHSLWQLSVLSTLLAVALRVTRDGSARLRSALASLTLLAGVAWFAHTAATAGGGSAGSSSAPRIDGVVTLVPVASVAPGGAAPGGLSAPSVEPFDSKFPNIRTNSPRRVAAGVTALWVLGVTVLSLRHLAGLAHIRRLIRSARTTVANDAVKRAVRRVVARLDTTWRPRVLVTDDLISPSVVGFFRPAVLLPASLVSGLPPRHLELLIAHEFAHIKHFDPLLNHLTSAAETLLFYHPATWWIAKAVRREREFACDDSVVGKFGDRHGYARALASVPPAPSTLRRGPALAAVGSRGRSPFAARIHRVLGIATPPPSAGPAPHGVIALAGLSAVAIAAAAAPPAVGDDVPGHAEGVRGDIRDRHGVVLASSSSPSNRRYPLRSNLAHVVGYTSVRSEEDRRPAGRHGIEETMEVGLAGGDDVYLTIDARIQTVVEKVLRQVGRGAAVVIEPSTGDILALASVPSFDPASFSPAISGEAFNTLRDDPRRPLFNRTLGQYPPASTFKLVTALAAADAGFADAEHECTGSFVIDGRDGFRCHKADGHGTLDLRRALVTSCNCYFYQLGIDVGASRLRRAAASLGFGAMTGIQLRGEQAGYIIGGPSAPTGEGSMPTTAADIANHTIGHGTTLASPVQLAAATATIANGGMPHPPRLIDRIVANRTGTTDRAEPPVGPSPPAIVPAHAAFLRAAMRATVNAAEGTGRRVKSDRVVIAGKSGTAKLTRRHVGGSTLEYLTWFTAFAPFENPELAVTIMVENGTTGGSTAGPLVKQVIEQSLLDSLPEPGSLPPHQGHFKKISPAE